MLQTYISKKMRINFTQRHTRIEVEEEIKKNNNKYTSK